MRVKNRDRYTDRERVTFRVRVSKELGSGVGRESRGKVAPRRLGLEQADTIPTLVIALPLP